MTSVGPMKVDFESPLSPALSEWLSTASKAAKALRVYEKNNTMVHQFLDRCYAQLEGVLHQQSEITLTVREDRLGFGKDPVHINNDRQEGLPFIFYRSGFRRITFVKGMEKDELLQLLNALATDFSSFEYVGEDLVSVLWRLALPHVRYFTLDALTLTADAATDVGKKQAADVERLQGEIDHLVAKLYNKEVAEEDLVKGVSITKEDLEALKHIREAGEEELEILDVATARVIAGVSEEEIAHAKASLSRDDHHTLATRLIDVLLQILYQEQSSAESTKTIELIQQLFDALLLANRPTQAMRLVQSIRDRTIHGRDLKEIHISRLVLRILALDSRVAMVLSAFNDAKQPHLEVIEFLRAIGPDVSRPVLAMIDTVVAHAHRRMLCELLQDLGSLDPALLQEKIRRAHWNVAVDLLALAQRLTLDEQAPIVLFAVEHDHPKVRAQAVSMLRAFPTGHADELISRALKDADAEVRDAAFRLVRQRRTPVFKDTLERMMKADDLWDRDERELRALTTAYAHLAGDAGIPLLEKVLYPGIFARSKQTNAQIAAAMALGKIGTEHAKEAIIRGSRTLNNKVRDACRRALMRDPEGTLETVDLHTDFTVSLAPPSREGSRADDPLARAIKRQAATAASQAMLPATQIHVQRENAGLVRAVHKEGERLPDRLPPAPVTLPPKAEVSQPRPAAQPAIPSPPPPVPVQIEPPVAAPKTSTLPPLPAMPPAEETKKSNLPPLPDAPPRPSRSIAPPPPPAAPARSNAPLPPLPPTPAGVAHRPSQLTGDLVLPPLKGEEDR
jgi:hypothetical protein